MKKCISVLIAVLFLLTGCSGKEKEPETLSFLAMDTTIDFSVYGDQKLLEGAKEVIDALEQKISVTTPESEVYAINRDGSGVLTGEADTLMQGALGICARTGGALDLSIYPVVRAWGFTTGQYQVPDEALLKELISHVDYTKVDYSPETGAVSLPEGMEIDLGSIGKGYGGELAAQFLRENGVTSALLNLGGNVQTIGTKPDGTPWQIAVKDPESGKPMMVLSIEDQAVVTSGGYERYFEEDGKTYWHIMNPETGHPAESGLLSVTIIGDSGMVCDGLSTALFVMGLEKAAALWAESDDFEAVFVTDLGEVYLTEGLKDRFALLEDHADTTVRVIGRS